MSIFDRGGISRDDRTWMTHTATSVAQQQSLRAFLLFVEMNDEEKTGKGEYIKISHNENNDKQKNNV